MFKTLAFCFFSVVFCYSSFVFGQNVVTEINSDSASSLTGDMITEKIFKISVSGRIIVITNSNEVLIKGDFISIIFNQDLVFRALIAKVTKAYVGIKVVKIYNEEILKKLKPGDSVLIIRGDDSYYRKKDEVGEDVEGKIKTEDNLFDDTLLEEDLTLQENSKRILKQDNIISVSYAFVEGVNTDHSSHRFGQFNGQWAYQFLDNVWGELGFGQHRISDFPDDGLDTSVTNFTFRVKYTFAGPFYSYIKPYFGFQVIRASDSTDTDTTQEQLDKETALYEKTEKTTPVVGITFLKRLVPGWFIHGNLGSDLFAMGFSLEF
ncbi:MAG: hypothetical protein A2381_12090 [Bdellovibrionales bacterium RIFOXYB1_FULL_37_110]|nr:MAG: hypothetical protein A2181_01810 [Bdellovibrionales bacterium RIFOXYA1_FULL_38_20]OFZ52237.1 MAG: hypothetical protein A2417_05930 [Bdellovibrionales bacterium RIFOXYC1_FULL_37_79]OFZ56864.1 MAG: hypothetical protein A2328_08700 [Bdellovibrionales bacterium RIFOXYB2_FULL_36_6]OFZ57224.1 MAG: hypothetical protein A2381_12090 [Bdellovibrionales bacterium RIFOXYB1_FULL_37_110]OFZ65226.1 MAG: hypothetical protein A2577_04525 [Bdellovibrionales bacterium RIFOXYD1_FULL_36_51]